MKYYVYLIGIEGTNTCKIGHTKETRSPTCRMKDLQTGNPFKLKVFNSFLSEYSKNIENILHRQYLSKKIDEDLNDLQGEWFELNNDDIKNFEEVCKKIESDIVFIIETSTLKDPLKYL